MSVYVASRTRHKELWRNLRSVGLDIKASWIDSDEENPTPDRMQGIWMQIHGEITGCKGVILYLDQNDFPIKGALVEVGMALAFNKPVNVVYRGTINVDNWRPIGSWLAHPLVRRFFNVHEAYQNLMMTTGR